MAAAFAGLLRGPHDDEEHLLVSMPTVKTLVAHVLAKTGTADRREVAAWAPARGTS